MTRAMRQAQTHLLMLRFSPSANQDSFQCTPGNTSVLEKGGHRRPTNSIERRKEQKNKRTKEERRKKEKKKEKKKNRKRERRKKKERKKRKDQQEKIKKKEERRKKKKRKEKEGRPPLGPSFSSSMTSVRDTSSPISIAHLYGIFSFAGSRFTTATCRPVLFKNWDNP